MAKLKVIKRETPELFYHWQVGLKPNLYQK